jgi:hypothetical protein
LRQRYGLPAGTCPCEARGATGRSSVALKPCSSSMPRTCMTAITALDQGRHERARPCLSAALSCSPQRPRTR